MSDKTTSTISNDHTRVSMTAPITILDGGMGREIERRGAPFRQPEWSALALSQAPMSVRDIHLDYIKAGATVITVNSYAVTPYHLGDQFFAEGKALIEIAATLAFEAVHTEQGSDELAKVKIAGCLPPLFGSYRPDLFDTTQASAIASPLLSEQAHYVDTWLVETQSSIIEAVTWCQLISEFTAAQKQSPKPIWIAFTLEDSQLDSDDNSDDGNNSQALSVPKLRSGESVVEAVQAMMALNIDALLFNCSQPEVMNAALRVAKALIDKSDQPMQLGVYANAFVAKQSDKQANAQLRQIREDTTPEDYVTWAKLWQASGATIIGGCCGIGIDHIEALARNMAN